MEAVHRSQVAVQIQEFLGSTACLAACGVGEINLGTYNEFESKYEGEACSPFEKGYRRKRISFTRRQLDALEGTFLHNKYPGITAREELSVQLGVSESRIQVWFQNRRSKWRKTGGGLPIAHVRSAVVKNAAGRSWPVPYAQVPAPATCTSPVAESGLPSGCQVAALQGFQPHFSFVPWKLPQAKTADRVVCRYTVDEILAAKGLSSVQGARAQTHEASHQ